MSPEPETASPLLQLPNSYRAFYGAFARLHPLQQAAIDPILEGRDLVLQSATGSGKTEAVLAPLMERVIRSGGEEAVAYVVPTRALAVDLQRRLEPILERLELRLAVRTGDLKRPGGGRPALMLTTPESLDVALGSGNPDLRAFVQRIRTVVIDEVHPLVHSYRGQQLAWLLRRLEQRAGPVQKIAVSATIGDLPALLRFFGFRPDTVRLEQPVHREIVPHFVQLKDEQNELGSLLDDLHDTWGYRKVLLFANSRSRCDRLFAQLSQQGRFAGVTGLHYSNLKPKERHAVERAFRRRSHALCIATSTLELGIDIGDVDGVLLYEPPDSVAAFLQRIGRSNRRGQTTRFWGICRGEQPGAQLLRFLALLRLAREGVVEAPREKPLPSVLVQQILSCLYEKKRISPGAMRALFPEAADRLEPLFEALLDRGWLREERTPGLHRGDRGWLREERTPGLHRGDRGWLREERPPELYRGGRRFWDCLLERRIWSNFPPDEEEYSLELDGAAIADLPKSVVKQLEAGDRVQLAGKRLQVVGIDTGERKRVLARPADRLDDKALFWLGAGLQVSIEVARSIREVLRMPAGTDEATGLFTRPRKLLQAEREQAARTVRLANGIELGLSPTGLYRYRTYLGSIGNLMLRRAIEQAFDATAPDLVVTSDEVGLTSTHRIDFQRLDLPTTREATLHFVERHQEAIEPLFPLNAFAAVLPAGMRVEELTGFLFDPRVAEAFEGYLREGSEIVAGDPAVLEPALLERAPGGAEAELPLAGEPLLTRERRRWRIDDGPEPFMVRPEARHEPRALTGTLVGDYLRHDRCERWLSFSFLPAEERPPMRPRADLELGTLRTEQGRRHEARVLEALESADGGLVRVAEVDEEGRSRPLETRFHETMGQLAALVREWPAGRRGDGYLAQGVLLHPAVLAGLEQSADDPLQQVNGAGIPDLIRVSKGPDGVMLEVGDIKDSRAPRESQKWQVAWYAWLLGQLIEHGTLPVRATVASSGFLILRPPPGSSGLEQHDFDLDPYLAAMPALRRDMARVFRSLPGQATWKLERHCTTCPFLESCYREGLRSEDIQFLPNLTGGMLEKLRDLELRTLDSLGAWIDLPPEARPGMNRFSASRRERLEAKLTTLRDHRAILRERRTRRFPANLSRAILVHLLEDPLSGMPRAMGFRVLDTEGMCIEAQCWLVADEAALSSNWRAFSQGLVQAWRAGIEGGRGPHLFHFGGRARRSVQAWDSVGVLTFLQAPGRTHHTDLRDLLLEHFDLPLPGTASLTSIAHLLGLEPPRGELETLLQEDDGPEITPEAWAREEVREQARSWLNGALEVMAGLWRWAGPKLESGWTQLEFEPEAGACGAESSYIRFLEEERRLREEDVLSLQRYPLAERVERFRAIGPLQFTGTALDEEGCFVYTLESPAEPAGSTTPLSPAAGGYLPAPSPAGSPTLFVSPAASKFREGDFLKLVPVGVVDLQSGFPVVLAGYDRAAGRVSVRSRRGRLPLSRGQTWSLEEDLTDWNNPKLLHAVRTVFSSERPHPLARLFEGRCPLERDPGEVMEVRRWLETSGTDSGLNQTQRRALELPFRSRIALIEGPPGTGKTHLLAWTLIVLIYQAHAAGRPMRIAVSALTHQAIDQVLRKVLQLVDQHGLRNFPGRCFKAGRRAEGADGEGRIEALEDQETLASSRYAIVGATGFALYQLFEGEKGVFPRVFDRVVFDEASQLLVPQALLTLLYGKGEYLFYGDVKQLPPVVMSREGEESAGIRRSILEQLTGLYGPAERIRLDITYRMNEAICAFPSRTWYDGELRPAEKNVHTRLELRGPRPGDLLDRVLEPARPVTLFLVPHRGCEQRSDLEVEVVTELACRLLVDHGLAPGQLALISPHRAQNSATAARLMERLRAAGYGGLTASQEAEAVKQEKARAGEHQEGPARRHQGVGRPDVGSRVTPLIDTVERVQGMERDVIVFALTASDPDYFERGFLNSPERFNVALTRARQKLIVVGSRSFFDWIPRTEEGLRANACFKQFLEHCQAAGSLYGGGDSAETLENGGPA